MGRGSPSALGATVIPAIAIIVWSSVDGGLGLKFPPRNTGREESRELVDRLLRQEEALKSENRKHPEAHRQELA